MSTATPTTGSSLPSINIVSVAVHIRLQHLFALQTSLSVARHARKNSLRNISPNKWLSQLLPPNLNPSRALRNKETKCPSTHDPRFRKPTPQRLLPAFTSPCDAQIVVS
jgi:hypothetical protein